MLAILKIAFLDTCKCLWKVGVFIVFGVAYNCGLCLLLKCAQFMQKIDLNIMKRLHMRWLSIVFLQIAKNPKMKFDIYSPFNWPFYLSTVSSPINKQWICKTLTLNDFYAPHTQILVWVLFTFSEICLHLPIYMSCTFPHLKSMISNPNFRLF